MKNNKTNQANLRRTALGMAAALLALACSGETDTPNEEVNLAGAAGDGAGASQAGAAGDDGTAVTPPLRPVGDNPSIDPCIENPLIAGCPDSAPPPAPGEKEDLATATVENILRSNCGQCHGSTIRNPRDAQARMNFIDDFDRLLEEGMAIGGDSVNSPIIRRMRDGSMPPLNSTQVRPSTADINTVANYLDDPNRFRAEDTPVCTGQLLEFDSLYDIMQGDLLTVDAEDRAFTRYVLLTNRYNQGTCSSELDRDRFGMNKMLNMLSIEARATQATPVDRDETIYRIDIRKYGWDREVEVNGEAFDDGWEAIAALNPYAVQFQGDEAEQLILQAETNFPWMYSDSMVDVATIGNLYYELIDVDVNNTLDDFILNELGIDVLDNLDQEDLIRAGTTKSIISRQDRVAERHDIGVRRGAFWQSFDFEAGDAGESIFADPFDFAEGGREVIFTLANGLMGFIIADENDAIVEESNILLDTKQNDFVARTSVSCSGCHAQGFLPMIDEVRNVVERNRFQFDADTYEAVLDVYPSSQRFAEIINDDSEVYRRTLAEIGVPTQISDPTSGVFLRFDQDMDISVVAGDLGVSEELLNSNIARLDPSLQIVRDGLITIDRNDFTNVFLASLCVMQSFSQNQPLQADCDVALEELNN